MAYVPKACGFVLVREGSGGWEYLLLTSRKHAERGLPKGHVDPAEEELQTALRETREETGLTVILPDPWFRAEIHYPVVRRGRHYEKTVVHFLARTGQEQVILSDEHTGYAWLPLGDALHAVPHANLRGVIRDAALFLKDRALFDLEPASEAVADSHLRSLPHATDRLLRHLRGGAFLARTFARALAEADKPVHEEAAAAGTLLHDVGRALGKHDDHQRVGLLHLRGTDLAAYGFACLSHFTKGALPEELRAAGFPEATIREFRRLIDGSTLTLEEHCAALADACMAQDEIVPPRERFADLRWRYDTAPLIDLQERRTEAIRRTLAAALGEDPLSLVGLAD